MRKVKPFYSLKFKISVFDLSNTTSYLQSNVEIFELSEDCEKIF